MTTIADVIERIRRDYLQPPGKMPSMINLGADLDDSSGTVTVDMALMSAEEQDMVGPGQYVEWDQELMLVVDTNSSDPPTELTVRREMLGTEAAAHDNAALGYVGDGFVPRRVIFDAVSDAIEALYPGLWNTHIEEAWASSDPQEAPAGVVEVVDCRVQFGSRWRRMGWAEVINGFPYSSTGVALQTWGIPDGTSIMLTYRRAPTRPTAESDTLASLYVDEGWVKIVVVAAVAQVTARVDLDRDVLDYITKALEAQGFPVGSGTDIRNALLQFENYLKVPAMERLRTVYPDTVNITPGWH